MQQLCAAIAGGMVEFRAEGASSRRRWPRGLAWKARSLGHLNGRLLDHAKFVELAMRSVEDALIIAEVDGRITFANRRAAAILGSSEQALHGRDLPGPLAEAEQSSPEAGRDVLVRLVVGGARPRHFTLRMAAVSSGEDRRGTVLGIVASFSDIARQHELQQTKNDAMALVSHEMRPLPYGPGFGNFLPNRVRYIRKSARQIRPNASTSSFNAAHGRSPDTPQKFPTNGRPHNARFGCFPIQLASTCPPAR
jgi:PAS domain S-box-containing protein